ncbi:hypothetical protein IFR04_006515 [Cadophora malorum]|uniref:Uncharacterized protein n=1 Tax=Cadophora malorum TaxID=108018 RepID=A0A8H7TII0_9HELO|nr:hypothetical protein IFR04_006515 [Cadophora malorum]
MPLFNRHPADTTTTSSSTHVVRDDTPQRKSTFFGRRNRSASPVRTTGRHSAHSKSPPRRGLLHRNEAPSILAARERVINAEKREKEADQALALARTAVREARDHIRFLEKEAAEEARLAKIKQSQAKSISKRGHGLGRHDHV